MQALYVGVVHRRHLGAAVEHRIAGRRLQGSLPGGRCHLRHDQWLVGPDRAGRELGLPQEGDELLSLHGLGQEVMRVIDNPC